MKDKSEYRQYSKKLRKSLDITEISKNIRQIIKETDCYKSAENVMLFYPLKTEINLLPLLDDEKSFYLPRVNGELLEVCPYKNGDNLIKSDLNIYEPLSHPVDKKILDIVFIPALCADKNYNRIGYGKGFYDRFISDLNSAKKMIVIPDELVFDNLPTNEYDKKCDGIITQKKASF